MNGSCMRAGLMHERPHRFAGPLEHVDVRVGEGRGYCILLSLRASMPPPKTFPGCSRKQRAPCTSEPCSSRLTVAKKWHSCVCCSFTQGVARATRLHVSDPFHFLACRSRFLQGSAAAPEYRSTPGHSQQPSDVAASREG